MAVQADHPVCRRHDEMQVVRDQEHAAARIVAQFGDQFVKGGFAGKIDALHRLVQNHDVGPAGRARAISARWNSPPERWAVSAFARWGIPTASSAASISPGKRAGQRQQSLDGKRQGAVYVDLLRHIADAKPRRMAHAAFIRLQDAQRHLGGRALARAVRADEGDDLAALDAQIDIAHQPAPVAINAGALQFDQCLPRRPGGKGAWEPHMSFQPCPGFRCLCWFLTGSADAEPSRLVRAGRPAVRENFSERGCLTLWQTL